MSGTKQPPYSVASEKLVIAALLRDPELLGDVRAVLPDADAFFRPEYGALYRAIGAARDERPDAGAGEVLARVAATGPEPGERAETALRELAGQGPPRAEALAHAEIVAEKARRRRLIAVVSDVMHQAYYSEEPTEQLVRRAGARLAELRSPSGRASSVDHGRGA